MEDAWCRNWSTSFTPKRSQSHSQSQSHVRVQFLSTSISPILSAQIRVQAKAQAWHQARARVPVLVKVQNPAPVSPPQQPCNWKPQSRGHASKWIRRGWGFSQQYSYACRYCTASPGWSPPCSWYGGQGDKGIDMIRRVLNPTLHI
jgi:hypothetical protein